MRARISAASGNGRASMWGASVTARGADPASLPVHAIASRSICLAPQNLTKPNNCGLRLRRQNSLPNWPQVKRKSHHWPVIRAKFISKEQAIDSVYKTARRYTVSFFQQIWLFLEWWQNVCYLNPC